jgi:hypothetical protein
VSDCAICLCSCGHDDKCSWCRSVRRRGPRVVFRFQGCDHVMPLYEAESLHARLITAVAHARATAPGGSDYQGSGG